MWRQYTAPGRSIWQREVTVGEEMSFTSRTTEGQIQNQSHLLSSRANNNINGRLYAENVLRRRCYLECKRVNRDLILQIKRQVKLALCVPRRHMGE